MSAPTLSPAALGSFTREAFEAQLAAQSGAPAWWLERKRAAFEKFAALPMPKRNDESWRFSTVSTIALDSFTPLSTEPAGIATAARGDFGGITPTLSFQNNLLESSQPLPAELVAQGVLVTTISEALKRHPELLKAHFMAQPQRLGSEKFAALHIAFLHDGAFIYIPKGVEVAAPIVISHAVRGSGAVVFPHTLVVAEENSKATVVDLFLSHSNASRVDEHQFALGANDLYAAHGAQLSYVGVQAWSRDTQSFQLNSTVVRRDARVQSLNLHLGGRQARHESLSQLQAPGAFSEMLALTIARGTQEFDQRTLQVHQAPNTKSDLLYKNALLDQAKTIFSGLIIVDPDAQKTDAYQSNRNLMLSDDAEANSLPGLEIQANDVRCTHGATSARIDREQEFYLQSRGIDKAAADELLVFGFFEEVLNRLSNETVRDALRGLIQANFLK
jgi:Fe-S cluster assembly protein SufD